MPSSTEIYLEREQQLTVEVLHGDKQALAELFALYRPRLWRMVNFRIDPRLQGRIDADDVLQDAYLRARERLPKFAEEASRSCFVWFRTIAMNTLFSLHRKHVGAQKRSAALEVSRSAHWSAESTSLSLTHHLIGKLSSPSSAAARAEMTRLLDAALAEMNEIDREILALRHFEELSNGEAAQVLEMSEQAASARYMRALARLKQALSSIPGLAEQAV